MNRIECKHCRNVSLAFDNFMDLSVPIPRSGVRITGNVDLETCIKAFISPEKMEECGYKCSKCKKVDNFEKQLSVFRFP
jgi:ubiquitin C-terminal hydrolase